MRSVRDARAPDHLATANRLPAAGPTVPGPTARSAGRADPLHPLDPRMVMKRAGRLLMTHHNMTQRDAFRWLLETAMNRRVSVLTIARAVVEGMPSHG